MKMHSDQTRIPRLQAIFEGAKSFGLPEDDAWRAVDESLDEVGGDATVSQFLEELVGALACRILTEQRNPSKDRRDGPEGPQVNSDELT